MKDDEPKVGEKDGFIEDTDEREETSDEKKAMMDEGKLDEDPYSKEGREKLVEDGEMKDWEQGFAEGAEGGGRDAKCRYCGKIIVEKEGIVEKEIEGELCFFCSNEHVEKYEEKQS